MKQTGFFTACAVALICTAGFSSSALATPSGTINFNLIGTTNNPNNFNGYAWLIDLPFAAGGAFTSPPPRHQIEQTQFALTGAGAAMTLIEGGVTDQLDFDFRIGIDPANYDRFFSSQNSYQMAANNPFYTFGGINIPTANAGWSVINPHTIALEAGGLEVLFRKELAPADSRQYLNGITLAPNGFYTSDWTMWVSYEGDATGIFGDGIMEFVAPAVLSFTGDYASLDGLAESDAVPVSLSTVFDPAFTFDNQLFSTFDPTNAAGFTPTPTIPEPATWAMMLGGFALAGMRLKKRRAAQASA